MQKDKIMVFFDESGKRGTKPNLMGGLSIPFNTYYLPEFKSLTKELQDSKMDLHFKNYHGDSTDRENFIKVGSVLAEYSQLVKMIVINYDYSMLANRSGFGKDLVEDMIYTKFPERILYGLLRGYGKHTNLEAEILIEKATEYETLNLFKLKDHYDVELKLDELVKDQLNIQSLYRGENYYIDDCRLVPKGKEIGVEMADMLLGFIRTILENKDSTGTKISAKNKLTMHMLRDNRFYSMMNNIRYFEWDNSNVLDEVSLDGYLQLFVSKHFDETL